MVEIPADVATGRVYGSVYKWLVDSVDAGTRPDAGIAAGSITFTPSVRYVMHPANGLILVPVLDPIPLDAVDSDIDVELVATDDTDINPTGWTYRVQLVVNGAQTIFPWSISVPGGSDRKITEIIPVETSEGVYSTVGPAGASAYQVAVANGFVGTESEWLDYLAAQARVGMVESDGSILRVTSLTQAAYDALSPKVSTTLYVITG